MKQLAMRITSYRHYRLKTWPPNVTAAASSSQESIQASVVETQQSNLQEHLLLLEYINNI